LVAKILVAKVPSLGGVPLIKPVVALIDNPGMRPTAL
jgi:hypothetical protein